MIRDIVKLLVKIAEGLNKNYSLNEVVKTIIKENSHSAGYNDIVITAAYSWFRDKIARDLAEEEDNNLNPASIRYLTEQEKDIIGIDNYNHLLHFYYIGLLTSSDIGMIVEQLSILPERLIALDAINLLIVSIFINFNNSHLSGSRSPLYSSDTIN